MRPRGGRRSPRRSPATSRTATGPGCRCGRSPRSSRRVSRPCRCGTAWPGRRRPRRGARSRESSQSTWPGVGAGRDPRQRRVRAVAVEVVEAQDREPEPFGEVRLAGARGPRQDDHLRRHPHIMPWQAASMGTRVAAFALLLALTACTDDDAVEPTTVRPDLRRRVRRPDPRPRLRHARLDRRPARRPRPPCGAATARPSRGTSRSATAPNYDKLCRTLDRSGGVGPGVPADWVGDGVVACAVEPVGGVGQTKVVVQREGDEVTQVTIAVLARTSQEQVRAAVQELWSARPRSGARPSWSRGRPSSRTGPAPRSSPARTPAPGVRA